MKKTIFSCLMAITAAVAFTACEDNDYDIVFPTWKGFQISSQTVQTGDTLIVTADLAKPGKNLYFTHYTWTMNVDTVSADGKIGTKTLVYDIKSTTGRPIHMNDQPKAYFKIPESAKKGRALRTINFQVNYENVTPGKPILYEYETADGYLGGTFVCQVQSELYSQAKCNFKTDLTFE